MLLLCLPFVIYSASVQMFLDGLANPVPLRLHEKGTERDR